MTSTTIKVTSETRDRLKAQAAADRVTLGEHLRRLADMADRDRRLTALTRAVEQTTLELRGSYATESAQWETAELTDARDS